MADQHDLQIVAKSFADTKHTGPKHHDIPGLQIHSNKLSHTRTSPPFRCSRRDAGAAGQTRRTVPWAARQET